MKRSVLILALAVAVACLLSACQKGNKDVAGLDSTLEQANPEQLNPERLNPEQLNPEQPDIAETDHETRTENLFELKEYDGVPEITLQWGDQQSPAQFHKAPLFPLGSLIPTRLLSSGPDGGL